MKGELYERHQVILHVIQQHPIIDGIIGQDNAGTDLSKAGISDFCPRQHLKTPLLIASAELICRYDQLPVVSHVANTAGRWHQRTTISILLPSILNTQSGHCTTHGIEVNKSAFLDAVIVVCSEPSATKGKIMLALKSKQIDGVRVVRFSDRELLDEAIIEQLGNDLQAVASGAKDEQKLLLSFRGVKFMSSAVLGKLVRFSNKCREQH